MMLKCHPLLPALLAGGIREGNATDVWNLLWCAVHMHYSKLGDFYLHLSLKLLIMPRLGDKSPQIWNAVCVHVHMLSCEQFGEVRSLWGIELSHQVS